ncbi:glycosyltransferase family 4 protein [Algoriphagus boritolerans]|uniref:Glycosyltransferase involved in cell wall bisynthesis n=1 Tax=Algoriphagus boritolerans DSM 17298 = JCM 18970 TaxID=1120964 RepID=A0A1H5RU28_9BACT|nr:glycosyltransferase family 4 protein [Algoriphagus boritolerans]SEF41825.1 Glycosyltransferase involved in cell wall bisynthesis [Algoriphagus boritolerans DSM 17298 = JCM 18970]
MNICFLTHEYPKPGLNPGGVGVFLKTFLPILAKNGINVTVLGANNSNALEDTVVEGVRVIRIPNPKIKGINWWFIAKGLNQKLQEIHADTPLNIVEGSELAFAFLKKPKGVKFIIRLHGGHHFFAESENRKIQFWKGFQEKRSFKKADAFIAVSDYVKVHTGNLLSFDNKPIKKIRYGIDTDKFNFTSDAFNSNPHSLVFVGTVCEKKGVKNLVLAIDQVKDQFPNVHLDIYGKDWYFSNGDSYKDMIREMIKGRLESHIQLHDPVPHDQIPEIYESAEICIFPSFMETQGLVAPEAMAMGKLVIFTDKGPGPETIQHGIDGFLCNPLEVSSIAEAIREAFQALGRKKEISRAARKTIEENFGLSKILKENVNFYNQVIHA